MVGGYVYLRYFNPVIVNPDGSNIIKTKPNRTVRRNLTLVAKILQVLSNGHYFGDKEQYMKAMNGFLREKREAILTYFDELTKVDDVTDAQQVDRYLEHAGGRLKSITISFNQACFCLRAYGWMRVCVCACLG